MKKKMLVFMLLVSCIGMTHAALHAYDPFDDGTAGSDVVGTAGGSGWAGPWTGTTGSFSLVDPGMTFTDVDSVGFKVIYDPGTSPLRLNRPLASAITVDGSNPEAWASALIEIGPGSGDVNLGRGIGIELTNSGVAVVGFGKHLNKEFGIGPDMSGSTWVNSGVPANTVGIRFVVLKLAFDGSDTVATVYVSNDPAADISDPTTFTGTASITITGEVTFDGVNLYGYHTGTTSNGQDEIRIADAYQDFFTTVKANTPTPKDGEELIPLNQQLSWMPPSSELYTPTGYDVWFGTEPNVLNGSYDMVKIESKDTDLTADPGTLINSMTYYWYVDAYEPNAPGPDTLHPGDLWSFTTEPPSVYFNPGSGPVPLTVEAGVEAAVFTVDASNVDTYTWYKDDDATPDEGDETTVGSNSPTLTIDPVSQSDEGWYYCVITNSLPPASGGRAVSDTAQLMTKRLVAHWAFDGTLTESEGGLTAIVIDPNTANEIPAFLEYGTDANSIVGTGALRLDNSGVTEGGWLQIADTNDLFNFYPQGLTISTWIKTPTGQSGEYNEIVSKNDGTTATRVFHRVAGTSGLFRMGSPGEFTDGTISDGEWHLFVSTYDPATGLGSVYRDEDDNEGTEPMEPLPNTSPLVIGGSYTEGISMGWIGWIDDVKIYSYPLTREEVAQEYFSVTGTRSCFTDTYDGTFDTNGDCSVDLTDFAEFAQDWLDSGLYPAP